MCLQEGFTSLPEQLLRAHQPVKHQCHYQLLELKTRLETSAIHQGSPALSLREDSWHGAGTKGSSPVPGRTNQVSFPKCEKGSCTAWQLAVKQKNHPMLHISLHQFSLPSWPHLQLSQSSERKMLHVCAYTHCMAERPLTTQAKNKIKMKLHYSL